MSSRVRVRLVVWRQRALSVPLLPSRAVMDIYYGDERAFRPSPTISALNVSQGNGGLSKKVSFTITAYTRGQAEVVIN